MKNKTQVKSRFSKKDFSTEGNFCPDLKTIENNLFRPKFLKYVVWAVVILSIAGSCIYAIKTLWD